MSNTASQDHDPESPCTVLISTSKLPRRRWLQIMYVLRAQKLFYAISNSTVSNDQKGSFTPRVSSPYNSLSTHDAGEIAELLLDVSMTIKLAELLRNQGTADSELTGTAEISPPSPLVFLDTLPHGDNDQNCGNRKHQHENIARIVKEKDLVTLRNFGGVQGIAERLNTDLENGIPDSEEDLCSWRIATTPSKTQAPA